MKPDEIRELTDRELQEQIDEREEELFRIKFRGAYQELENPALVKELRRDVARMKTIQRERELAEAEEADE